MEYAVKKLAPGENRFRLVTRLIGRRTTYEIYDRVTVGFPVQRPGLGRVKQDLTSHEEVEAEMQRLEEFYQGE